MFATKTAERTNSKRTQPKTIWLVLFLLLSSQADLVGQDEAQSETPRAAAEEQKKIELVDSPNGHVIDFNELSPADVKWTQEALTQDNPHSVLSERFRITLSTPGNESPKPMMGKFLFVGSSLRFQPRFPFQKGTNYLVRQLVADEEPHELSFSLPVEKKEPTRVVKVYPTADELPENLLKFYLHFSAPMRHGEIYDHLRIEKADGTRVVLPFLEIDQELWSRDGLRLTLLLDPGRIKRGLKPREEMGPIFETGESYRLIVADSWIDANRSPLEQQYVKSFTVGEVDDEQPNPVRWKIQVPLGQSQDPAIMTLDEPCDSALLMRIFQIENQHGNSYLKSVELDENEKVVRFYPVEPWWPGMYNLKVSGILEDLCGNSVEKKFDIDKFRATRESDDIEMTEIEFEVK
jgi:hypothetical protein